MPLDRSELPRILRYLAAGGVAASVNWGSRFAWNLIMPFTAAVAAAYLTGMVVAFVLFRLLVFPASPTPLGMQIRNFALVNAVGIVLTWTLAVALGEHILPGLGLGPSARPVGHALAIAAPTITSWFGHRYLTFRTA